MRLFFSKVNYFIIAILVFGSIIFAEAKAESQPIPRVIFAFYDKDLEKTVRNSFLHSTLEMPLNWLGYHLEFYEKNDALPKWRTDVAGVVLSLPAGSEMPDMQAYIAWINEGISLQKKLLAIGNMGFEQKWADSNEGAVSISKILGYLGIINYNQWVGQTYNSKIIYKNSKMVEYERKYPTFLPPYNIMLAQPEANTYLKVEGKDDSGEVVISDLVVTNKNGGFAAESYWFYFDDEIQNDGVSMKRWLINPFAFLNEALGAKYLPRADVSTLDGRRIFYSHLDGDGWNNYSEVNDGNDPVIAAKVLFEHIYKKYRKIPFTVAPIVSDLDVNCHGRPESAAVARDIFALPNIEPSSHTNSHPLLWRYFDDMNPAAELKYLGKYPAKSSEKTSLFSALSKSSSKLAINEKSWDNILQKYSADDAPITELDKIVMEDFETPRSYACAPFNLDLEIDGSAQYIQKLSPPEKKLSLIQWSGDTSPAESALRKVRESGLLNINGGDSRLDPLYASYAYVAPIGIKVGNERQIFSSNSNENTYTSLWTHNFFGFRYLVSTVRNTETPRRISPFNIYYHAYSGEKQSSLQALKQNIEFAVSQPVIPIFTSEYASIANGYYSAQFFPLAENKWRVENRGELQTIRFDNATILMVDFEDSQGVIGQHHYQGSLYVFLNPKVASPIISLKKMETLQENPASTKPYLIESRWVVRSWKNYRNGISMDLQGFDDSDIKLYWPNAKKVSVVVRRGNKMLHKEKINVNDDILKISLQNNATKALTVYIVNDN